MPTSSRWSGQTGPDGSATSRAGQYHERTPRLLVLRSSNGELSGLTCGLHAGLRTYFADEVGTVAVLTPYKAQVPLLRNKFREVIRERRLDREALQCVDFATVDGYQV